jgi:hypothetical protein
MPGADAGRGVSAHETRTVITQAVGKLANGLRL